MSWFDRLIERVVGWLGVVPEPPSWEEVQKDLGRKQAQQEQKREAPDVLPHHQDYVPKTPVLAEDAPDPPEHLRFEDCQSEG